MRTTSASPRDNRMGSHLRALPTLAAIAFSAVVMAACADAPTAPTFDAARGPAITSVGAAGGLHEPPDPCSTGACVAPPAPRSLAPSRANPVTVKGAGSGSPAYSSSGEA